MLNSLERTQVVPIRDDEQLWLMEDVMKYLRCSRQSVWRYMKGYGLPFIQLKDKRRILFLRGKVMEWAISYEQVDCSAVH
jgi:predicted DNA-binding transcriptional regulator AlpA